MISQETPLIIFALYMAVFVLAHKYWDIGEKLRICAVVYRVDESNTLLKIYPNSECVVADSRYHIRGIALNYSDNIRR